VEVRGNPDPQKPVERYVPSIQRAKFELGLGLTKSLASAIQATIQFKKNGS
jgi:hypothetical protein